MTTKPVVVAGGRALRHRPPHRRDRRGTAQVHRIRRQDRRVERRSGEKADGYRRRTIPRQPLPERWNAPIREVLVYDLSLPVQYISSNSPTATPWPATSPTFRWTPNETIMLGIGQSITQITPIAAAIASRPSPTAARSTTRRSSTRSSPRTAPWWSIKPVVANQIETDRSSLPLSSSQEWHGQRDLRRKRQYRRRAVQKFQSTIAAKTGTSQRTEIDVENNSWLVCYAPVEDPKIAVVVYIQNGYAGARSASAAIETITYYLDNYGGYESTEAVTGSPSPFMTQRSLACAGKDRGARQARCASTGLTREPDALL